MSQVQHAKIEDPSSDEQESNPSSNEQESNPSSGNSSTNNSSGEESAGNVSSSEEESDGDFDITGAKQTCPYCLKKMVPAGMRFHNKLIHAQRPFVEEHVCIYCMAVFPDYFQMIAHQNQCLGNQL